MDDQRDVLIAKQALEIDRLLAEKAELTNRIEKATLHMIGNYILDYLKRRIQRAAGRWSQ